MKLRRGLTAVAVLIAALALSPASALAGLHLQEGTETLPTGEAQLAAASYPSTITGERFEEGKLSGQLKLVRGSGAHGLKVACEEVEVSGGTLSEGASELSLAPNFSGCHLGSEGIDLFGSLGAAMNGCTFRFPSFGPYTGELAFSTPEIACPPGAEIEIGFGVLCAAKIPPQKLSTESGVQNVKPEGGSLLAVVLASGLRYTVSGGDRGICNLANLSTGSFEDGAMELDLRLRGAHLQEGTETLPTGEAQLAATSYPSTVTGERFEEGPLHGKLKVLTSPKFTLTCDEVDVSGGTLTQAASTISLTPNFSGCAMEPIGKASISMNGCSYRFPKFGPFTKGLALSTPEIACPPGEAVEVQPPLCKVTIPPQKLSSESGVQNTKPESGPLLAVMLGSGMHYTAAGFGCELIGLSGNREDGSTEIDLRLEGS